MLKSCWVHSDLLFYMLALFQTNFARCCRHENCDMQGSCIVQDVLGKGSSRQFSHDFHMLNHHLVEIAVVESTLAAAEMFGDC